MQIIIIKYFKNKDTDSLNNLFLSNNSLKLHTFAIF